MKSKLFSLLSIISASALAQVGDSGQISTVFFTNSADEDVKLIAGNPPNDSGYAKFNCLYPIPKQYQDVPSPAFRTMMEPGTKQLNSLQYALIPAGATVAYAFSSDCDVSGDHNKTEAFSLRSVQDYNKAYVVLGNMHQDLNHGVMVYTKYISAHAIWGDVVSRQGIAPFHVTVLPLN